MAAAVSDGVNICGSCALSETFCWSTCLAPRSRSPSSHSKWTWSGSATGPVETKRGNGAKTPTTPTLKNARHVHVTTPVAIPRQWANRRQEASERGAAAVQVARAPCIMFHVVFTSPQAVHITLCRLFYALLVRLLVFHNQVVINVSLY